MAESAQSITNKIVEDMTSNLDTQRLKLYTGYPGLKESLREMRPSMDDNPFVNPSEETARAINEHESGNQPTMTEYSPYQVIARGLVFDYVREHLDKTDKHVTFGIDEVYVVWFSKVLRNWKALVSTTLPDGMYYEVTYDGNKGLAYLDAYKKFENREIAIPAHMR